MDLVFQFLTNLTKPSVIQIYAMDADKGTILWQSNAGQSTGGGIITYRAGGRQLIGAASGMKSPM
jgi:outer membrane protein assembly factor BamB